ncbi:accessory factor UbiK family protein [Kerstersia similis]|uniref:accessory factor UbiK family protein n=1 Tax=Kerstersia similis TaxID=206505 RepID=UPI0039F02DF7
MNRTDFLADLQQKFSDLIARTPAADIERNAKAFLSQAFSRVDLITREEFDIQADLLAATRSRVRELEARLEALEGRVAALEQPTAAPGSQD